MDSPIVIVGAGCFGISTAWHLLKAGYNNVTVIDRSPVLPAVDAASTDLNKIVRSAYNDKYYAQFAHLAIEQWKNTDQWGDTYHESGVLVLGQGANAYANLAYENDCAVGGRILDCQSSSDIRATFPPSVPVGSFEDVAGYHKQESGWANSAKGLSIMTDAVVALGGKVLPSKATEGLIRTNGKTTGVLCTDGSQYEGLVVLAAGAWTSSSFPELNLSDRCLATGHCVATIQLTPEEAAAYQNVPVVLNFSTGFYVFPPNEENIVKLALHDAGVTSTSPDSAISVPRTIVSHGTEGLRIPKTTTKFLRESLAAVYPELSHKPFTQTRMCWYTDAPDGDWIISKVPSDEGIILATAGSGHAYKFLPIIGGLVSDLIQGKLSPELVAKFAVDRKMATQDESRLHFKLEELDTSQLCTAKDLEGR